MDYDLLSLIGFAFIIFTATIVKVKRNDVDVMENMNGIIVHTFSTTLGTSLAISLIFYAIFDEMLFGLSMTHINFGVIISGVFLLSEVLKSFHGKFGKDKH